MRLYVIRHGVTLPSRPGQPRMAALAGGRGSGEGTRRRSVLEKRLRLYSSPEEKTLATVRPASQKHGLEIREDHRLREARRPARWIEDYDSVARRYLEDLGNPPKGWEDAREVKTRTTERVEELEERHAGESVAVCSHGLAPVLYLSGLPSFKQNIFDFWRSIGFCRVVVLESGDLELPFRDPAKVP